MLPRLLSRWNVASRREAEALVACGRVTVDGKVVRDVLRMVSPRAQVCVDGVVVGAAAGPVWLALNKPRGVLTTTHDPQGRPTVMALVPPSPGLAPVGRLDQDSAGLLLLTNEHAVAARLLAPASHVQKVYRVKVRGIPDAATLDAWRSTSLVDQGDTLGPMGVALLREGPRSAWLEVTLEEGKNRQVRRRLGAAGHEVEVLIRERFGPVVLGDLAPGKCRPLSAQEREAIGGAGEGA